MAERFFLRAFAWAIGVLVVLWLAANCLGGTDNYYEPDPEPEQRDAEIFAADCARVFDALDLVGQVEHDNADEIINEIDFVAGDITDPDLAALVESFEPQVRDMVDGAGPDDQERIEDAYLIFRAFVEMDLSVRCVVPPGSDS